VDISGDVNSVVRLFWLPITAMVLPAAYSTMLHRVTLPFGNTNSDISIPLFVTIIMTQFENLTSTEESGTMAPALCPKMAEPHQQNNYKFNCPKER
jgi:hypothetical protein